MIAKDDSSRDDQKNFSAAPAGAADRESCRDEAGSFAHALQAKVARFASLRVHRNDTNAVAPLGYASLTLYTPE